MKDGSDGFASSSGQGGYVKGTTAIDMLGAQGSAIKVAKASFDPGYSLKATLSDAGTTFSEADLRQGFCTYGRSVGGRR